MLKLILNFWRNNALFWALLASLAIVIGSLINPSYIVNVGLQLSDKIIHTMAYMILALVWLMYAEQTSKPLKHWIVIACLIIFGIVLELIQGTLTQTRSGEWYDVLANVLGLMMGLMIYNFLIKKLIR